MDDARAVRLETDLEHKRELARNRSREYRTRKRGGAPPREPKPCGTRAARVRHRRNPEKYGTLEDCLTCSPSSHNASYGSLGDQDG